MGPTALRVCIDCRARIPKPRTRCVTCERSYQAGRNAGAGYRRTGAWQQLSKAARKRQPWCSECGATSDLTVDHVQNRSLAEGVRVLCRSCNGRKQ